MAKKTSSRKNGDSKVARSAAAKSARAAKKAAPKAAPKPATKAAAKPAKATRPAAAVAIRKPVAAPAPAPLPKGKLKSPLSKKELADFREMLLAKRRTLIGDMNGMEAEAFRANRMDGSSDLSTMPVHMADIGTDNYEQEFTLGLLESERQLLREINEALDRIEKGTFGVCLGTGLPISPARLKAKPWAKYGIEYARQLEQGLIRQPAPMGASSSAEDEEEEAEGEEQAEEEEEAEVDIEEELAAQEAEDDLSM